MRRVRKLTALLLTLLLAFGLLPSSMTTAFAAEGDPTAEFVCTDPSFTIGTRVKLQKNGNLLYLSVLGNSSPSSPTSSGAFTSQEYRPISLEVVEGGLGWDATQCAAALALMRADGYPMDASFPQNVKFKITCKPVYNACGKNAIKDQGSITVTNTATGQSKSVTSATIQRVPTAEGETVTVEAVPSSVAYRFKNWEVYFWPYAATGTVPVEVWPASNYTVDPETNKLTYTMPKGHVAVVANYEEAGIVMRKVTFNSQQGSSVPSANVQDGDPVPRPADPTRAGYVFRGWYTEAACTNEWNFDTPITGGDKTLHAKWDPDVPATFPAVFVSEVNLPGTIVLGQYLPINVNYYYHPADGTFQPITGTVDQNLAALKVDLPVGQAVDADRVPALAFADGLPLPSRGVSLNSWKIRSVSGIIADNTPYTADTVLSAATAQALTTAGQTCIVVGANLTQNFTVTFNTDGGTQIPDQYVSIDGYSGKKIPQPADPVKAGYLFRGWFHDPAFAYPLNFNSYGFNCDRPVYAKFVEECAVTYDAGGVPVSNLPAPLTVGKGDKLSNPGALTPTVTGKNFVGWYKDAACTDGNEWNFATDTVQDANTTIYAKWETVTSYVTVNFKYENPNGSEETVPSLSAPIDTPVGGSITIPALPGDTEHKIAGTTKTYQYTKWIYYDNFEKKDFTAATVITAALLGGADHLDVFAEKDTYITFTFVSNGGTAVPSQTGKGETVKATRPSPDPTKVDHNLVDWCTDANLTAVFDFNTAVAANTTLYAKWAEMTRYDVTFNKDPAGMTVAVYRQGESTALTPTTATASQDVYKLTNGTYRYTASMDGYAPVEQIFSVNGAAIPFDLELTPFRAVTDVTLPTEVEQQRSINLPQQAVVTPADYTGGEPVWTLLTTDIAGLHNGVLAVGIPLVGSVVKVRVTIPAGQTPTTPYTKDISIAVTAFKPRVSFSMGGLGTQIEPIAATNGQTIARPADPQAPGWQFVGWYKEATYNNLWNFDTDVVALDLTLYARWQQETTEHTATFAGGEGAAGTAPAAIGPVQSGQSIALPVNPFTKEGHIFGGWKLGSVTYLANANYMMPNNDVAFTAQWIAADQATITQVINSLAGVTTSNAVAHTAQINAAVAAMEFAVGTSEALNNSAGIAAIEALYKAANGVAATVNDTAGLASSIVGAAFAGTPLQSVQFKVMTATQTETVPGEYEDYTIVPLDISLLVNGSAVTGTLDVPVVIEMNLPAALADATNIRILHYHSGSSTPTVITPTVSGGKLRFAIDRFSHAYIAGYIEPEASDDTTISSVQLKYNGTVMGTSAKDAGGNWTITLPSSVSESQLQELGSGTSWKLHIQMHEGATVRVVAGYEAGALEWWNTGVILDFWLDTLSNFEDDRDFVVTAQDGTTTANFKVTVKKILPEDQTYTINTSNIVGGTVTASPNPAAEGETVTLTITPNSGKTLVAGSLKYTPEIAGDAPVPIDETTLTFVMPNFNVGIACQFKNASGDVETENPPRITSFKVGGVSAAVNDAAGTISIILPYGSSLKTVAPTITAVNASGLSPDSGTVVDLSSPVVYTVYGTDGTTKRYTVSAYVAEGTPAQQLWEKITEAASATPWWQTAQYQKSTGQYAQTSPLPGAPFVPTMPTTPIYSSGSGAFNLANSIYAQCGNVATELGVSVKNNYVRVKPGSIKLTGSFKNIMDAPKDALGRIFSLEHAFLRYDLGQVVVDIMPGMETATGLKINVCSPASDIQSEWSRVRNRKYLYEIQASSTKAGLVLHFALSSDVSKGRVTLMKYSATRGGFVEVDRDLWTLIDGVIMTDLISPGVYGVAIK